MLNKAAKPLVKLVDRYLPDPYIFVLLLTLVVLIAAVVAEHKTPLEVINYWGDGFWTLLSFSMQMLLVLVAGFMLLVRRRLKNCSMPLLDSPSLPLRPLS